MSDRDLFDAVAHVTGEDSLARPGLRFWEGGKVRFGPRAGPCEPNSRN
jgi:hypothetical protein